MLELRRDLPANLPCTLGRLTLCERSFHTIERPWVVNQHGGRSGAKYVSCVAPGIYRLEPYRRPSGERAFILRNPQLDVYGEPSELPVKNSDNPRYRTLVLIHTANYVSDVVGCIGVGMTRFYNQQRGEWMITRSRDAMNDIRQLIGRNLDLRLRIE